MTIEEGKDEIYMRYRSYKDHKDWKKELVEKLPVKIDIGAVYNISVVCALVDLRFLFHNGVDFHSKQKYGMSIC